MKNFITALAWVVAGTSGVHAMTVSWSSELFSDFRDSFGNPLDETFTIQLGFFENVLGQAFVPAPNNVTDWTQQWRVFDQASLNLGLGYFTSEARVNEDGMSSSGFADLGLNFEGQQAFIWIRKGDDPVPGSEWFLAGASSWVFPEGSDECCDTTLPLQWSITDLTPEGGGSVTPVWGGQTGTKGSGFYATTDPGYTLQTFTFVPEPSAFLLTMTGSLLLLRRKRAVV
jgi:hypothetical protein